MDAAGDFGKLLVAQRRSYDGNDGNPWESMELNQEFCPEQGSLQYDNMMVVSEIVLNALRMRKHADVSRELRQAAASRSATASFWMQKISNRTLA